MGAAAAAMLQDDSVVQVAYNCSRAKDLLDAIDHRLKALTVLPQTSRPSSKTVDRRAKRIFDQLAKLKEEEENEKRRQEQEKKEREAIARGEILDENHGEIVSRRGGVFLRRGLPGPETEVLTEAAGRVHAGRVAGLDPRVRAEVCSTSHPGHLRRISGEEHVAEPVRAVGRGGVASSRLFESEHPTLFGLSVHGHDVTLHFLINDVLMTLFFGLAVKEIAEAFQPGGSLYPPGRRAVNPLWHGRRGPRSDPSLFRHPVGLYIFWNDNRGLWTPIEGLGHPDGDGHFHSVGRGGVRFWRGPRGDQLPAALCRRG